MNWIRRGLRFECQPDCGACCTNHDDYAYVYLDEGEVEALAAELDLPVDAFRRRYTEDDDGWTVLRMDQPDCPFLDGTRCGVYVESDLDYSITSTVAAGSGFQPQLGVGVRFRF